MNSSEFQTTGTRGISVPARPLPPQSWDTHAHVFGPFDQYPLAADSRYQPPLATRAAHSEMISTAGFAHGVLVHASACGFDNRCTLDAIACNPASRLGVAVVSDSVSDEELLRLHDAGIRGLRFTETGDTFGSPKPSGVLGLDALRRMAPRLRALGWHAQIWSKCQYIVDSIDWLSALGMPLVFDHMGFFDVGRGPRDALFQRFVAQLEHGFAWVKLTPIRVSKCRWNDCSDVRPFHDALLAKAPHRMIWGSDWPYIGLDRDLPNVGGLIDLFDNWTADEALRQRVFVENPAALYGRTVTERREGKLS